MVEKLTDIAFAMPGWLNDGPIEIDNTFETMFIPVFSWLKYLKFGQSPAKLMTGRLQSYVTQAAKEVDELGDAAFTPKQLQAIQRNPNLRAMYRGNRIDVRARQLIKDDPVLSPLISNYSRGADFVDPATGNWWDMTTPGSWPYHVKKYGTGGTLLRTQ